VTVFAKVEVLQESFRQAEAHLTAIPFELRTAVLPKALLAAAAPVVQAARKLAPDSVKSGSRKKWSKKVRDARSGTKQHKETIGTSSVRQYGGRGAAAGSVLAIYAGPLYPQGNLINAIGHPHAQVLWGRKTGTTLPATDYLLRASEQTKSEQQSAFVSKVKSESERILAKK
jgi:hypothetical protein